MIPQGFTKVATIGLKWCFEYNPDTTYHLLNCVYVPEEGRSYVALKDNPSFPPTHDGVNWCLISDRGRDGEGGVTGIKGEAEKLFRKGNVTITLADLGIPNVKNESPEQILARLTKKQIEYLLGMDNIVEKINSKLPRYEYLDHMAMLKETLDEKADKDKVVSSVSFQVGDEVSEPVKGDIIISAKDIGLDKVSNESSDEIIERVRNEVTPEDIEAVATVETDHKIVYGADENGNTIIEFADRQQLADLFLELQDAFNNNDKEKFQQVLDSKKYDLVENSGFIDFLFNEYKKWMLHNVLTDIHPITGIKLPNTDYYRTGLIDLEELISESFGLVALALYGTTESSSEAAVKTVYTEDGFDLKDGQLLYLTFSNDNLAARMCINLNDTGDFPVKIKNKFTDSTVCRTFKKDGEYLFRFDGNFWNFISGTNDIIHQDFVTLFAKDWHERSDHWLYYIEIDEIRDTDNISISAPIVLEDSILDEYERILLSGRQIETGLLLRAERQPELDLPAIIRIE